MKEDFFLYQGQTTEHPLGMEVSEAKGCYIIDTNNKHYLDFVAGVSACPLGHRHPNVVKAIKRQVDKYLHVMVYGEYIQQPAVELAKLLSVNLPDTIQSTYLTNSGTEAVEGSIKLARRYTGRSEVIAAKYAYHGNTIGAMSVMGFEERKKAFRPLVPDTRFIEYNNQEMISCITEKTAAVILETIQGGAGFIEPINNYLKNIQLKCNEVGALLILDEIQTGFGRTGKMFGFEHYDCIPDVVVIGKGLGGGMPIGAFSTSKEKMDTLMLSPKLGHITTFGGHPVIAAAALATLKELGNTDLIEKTLEKERFIRERLQHPLIQEIRGKGLMLAALLESKELTDTLVLRAQEEGLILFWLLFEPRAIRITPPLTISMEELHIGCDIIIKILNDI